MMIINEAIFNYILIEEQNPPYYYLLIKVVPSAYRRLVHI
jgi:hypothetical protein